MAHEVRILTDAGLAEFRDYLHNLRDGDTSDPPEELLTDPDTSQPFSISVHVENRVFAHKLEAAQYLDNVFRDVDIWKSTELWSWLALFYFDQLCPAASDGTRKPGKDWYYIPADDFRHYYRHKLLAPFKIYERHNEDAHVLLKGPLAKPGDFNEQIASRQEFIQSYGIVKALDLLYFDFNEDCQKRGALGKKRGTLRRFIDVIQQLDLTYDIYAMPAEQILDILPAEFDVWRPR